jgi:hypothetical protein
MQIQTIQQLIPLIKRGNTKATRRNLRSLLRQNKIHPFYIREVIRLMETKGSKIYNSSLKPLFIKHLERVSEEGSSPDETETKSEGRAPIRIKSRRDKRRERIVVYREPKEGEFIDTSNKFLEMSDL